ncbi:hypothetical protein IAU60_003648 [Kwoniella sp. DSM 27419]
MAAGTETSLVSSPADATQDLWGAMGVTDGAGVWWSALGNIIQAMVLSGILGQTMDYFDYFGRRDNRYALAGIAFGTLVAIGTVGLTCAQTYVMVHRESLDAAWAIRFMMMVDMTLWLVGALFNLSAGTYFAVRAYKMSGRNKWVLPVFGVGLVTQLAAAIAAVAKGYTCPLLTVETLGTLPAFIKDTIDLFKIWAATTLTVDTSICIFVTIMLFRSKDGIFHMERKIYRKLISLTYETMLPPVLCLLVLESTSWVKTNPMTDYRRIFTSVLPVLYYHSLIHTLVGRQQVRVMLDQRLAEEGVQLVSSPGAMGSADGKGASPGRVYASAPAPPIRADEPWTGAGGYRGGCGGPE